MRHEERVRTTRSNDHKDCLESNENRPSLVNWYVRTYDTVSDRPMKPLFLGSHPATDFLNTLPTPRGVPIELIGDGPSFLAWLYANGRAAGSRAGMTRPAVEHLPYQGTSSTRSTIQ